MHGSEVTRVLNNKVGKVEGDLFDTSKVLKYSGHMCTA